MGIMTSQEVSGGWNVTWRLSDLSDLSDEDPSAMEGIYQYDYPATPSPHP